MEKMKAKLIKEKDGRFHLWLNIGTKDTDHIASNEPLMGEWGRNLLKYKLSLKNCQAIERGYDLDELAEKACPDVISSAHSAYKAGFQKALELMGDKWFTEEEAYKIWKAGQEYWKTSGESITFEELVERKVELLQQNEWEVEIETYCTYGDDCPSKGAYLKQHLCNVEPKLDADGCLILKRV